MVTDEIKKLRKEKFQRSVISYFNFVVAVFSLLVGVFFISAMVALHDIDMIPVFLGIPLCFTTAGSFMNGMRQFRKLLAVEDQLEKLEKVAAEAEQKPEPANG